MTFASLSVFVWTTTGEVVVLTVAETFIPGFNAETGTSLPSTFTMKPAGRSIWRVSPFSFLKTTVLSQALMTVAFRISYVVCAEAAGAASATTAARGPPGEQDPFHSESSSFENKRLNKTRIESEVTSPGPEAYCARILLSATFRTSGSSSAARTM